MTAWRDPRVVVGAVAVGLVVTAVAAGTPGTTKRSVRVPSGSILFLSKGPDRVNRYGVPQKLYALDTVGGGRLREVLVDVEEAHWSPDGKRFAFLRLIRGETQAESRLRLFVTAPGGRRPRLLASYAGYGPLPGEWTFGWSPDSTRIAYASPQGVRVVGVDGKHGLRIDVDGTRPVWSPDGRRIALTRTPQTGGALYVARADGSGVSLVHTDLGVPATSISPQPWSPDGSRIAASICCDRRFAIIELGSGHTRILEGLTPSWAPNGRWIATSTPGPERGVWLMRPDGTDRRKLATGLLVAAATPVWSPDSRALAITDWCCLPDYEGQDVWMISVPDGQTRRVTQGDRYGYPNESPEWHPTRTRTAQLPGRYVSSSIPTDSIVDRGVLKTTAPIAHLDADDSAVLLGKVIAANGRSCLTEVWQPAQRRITRFPECGRSPSLAGERVVWTYGPVGWGDGERWFALTSTLTRPRATTLPRPWPTGRPLGPPVGDGSLAVFALWGPCLLSHDYDPCPDEPRKPGELYRLDGETLIRVTTSPTALTPLSVDAGRILVDHEDGTFELLRPDGTSIRIFRLNRSIIRGVRLQGRDLVVQTTSAVELTNADNGEFLRRWPLPSANARLEDVQDGIAVFVDGRAVTLLRLSNGTKAVIEAPSSQDVLAQIEPSGLFYSYTVDDRHYPGRVAFVPSQDLPVTRRAR